MDDGLPTSIFHVFDFGDLELLSTFTAPELYTGADDLELTRDARTLVGVSGDGTMRFWNVRTGNERARTYLNAHGYEVALSPDERLVAAPYKAEGATGLRVWEFASGRTVADLAGLSEYVVDIAIAQRGTATLVAATDQQRYKVWSLPDANVLLEGDVPGGAAVAFTPEGELALGLGSALVTLAVP